MGASTGRDQFYARLDTWSGALTTSAAGLCVAGILEAVGQAEAAVRILDRLVRKEIGSSERGSEDYRGLQLNYGRLGGAWGRFIAVPDPYGRVSNASAEVPQSLYRLLGTDLQFIASAWIAIVMLWLGDGERATQFAYSLIQGFEAERCQWDCGSPRSDEEIVDAWISAAQVLTVHDGLHIRTITVTAPFALKVAQRCGDVVRAARVAALTCLAHAPNLGANVPEICAGFQQLFTDAERVGDRVAIAFRDLSLGRWYVGPNGLALAQQTGIHYTAWEAVHTLRSAKRNFASQGMDPWILFSNVQLAKAYADLRYFDAVIQIVDALHNDCERFPIFTSHAMEMVSQVKAMTGDPDGAREAFNDSITAAREAGLVSRMNRLIQHLH